MTRLSTVIFKEQLSRWLVSSIALCLCSLALSHAEHKVSIKQSLLLTFGASPTLVIIWGAFKSLCGPQRLARASAELGMRASVWLTPMILTWALGAALQGSMELNLGDELVDRKSLAQAREQAWSCAWRSAEEGSPQRGLCIQKGERLIGWGLTSGATPEEIKLSELLTPPPDLEQRSVYAACGQRALMRLGLMICLLTSLLIASPSILPAVTLGAYLATLMFEYALL